MRLFVVTLFAVLVFASPAYASGVTFTSVDNTSPTNVALARTVYTVKFTTTTGLSGTTARIRLTFPAGTSLANWTGGTITVGSSAVGFCSRLTDPNVECSLSGTNTIAAGTAVTVTVEGVTNPAANGVFTLSTTADVDAQTKPVSVVAPQNVAGLSVTNADPTAVAGARTVYRIGFTTSSTGALSEEANSRINITFPAGTSLANWTGGTVTVAGTAVGFCSRLTDPSTECWLASGQTIAANTAVSIVFEGLTNPPSSGTFTLATTSDLTAQNRPVTVVAPQASSALAVSNSDPTAVAGARTVYRIAFTTSSTGALSEEANSRINITFPAGTSLANWTGGTVTVAGTAVGFCSRLTDPSTECWLASGRTIAANTLVSIVYEGVTNPGANGTFSLSTTSDPPAQNQAVTVIAPHDLTGLTAANDTPTSAAGGRTAYRIAFTTSSTGALSEEANSRINITFPAGTSLANWTGGTVTVAGTAVGFCSRLTDPATECWLASGRTIAANTALSIVFEGVTNPLVGGSLSVSTTSDPAAQSRAISVTAANPLTDLTVSASSLAPSATARYVVRFVQSSTGGLSEEGNSRIRLTLHAGTSLTNWSGGTLQDETAGTTVGACSRLTDPDLECWLFVDHSIAAGHRLRITLENVKNPTTAPPYRLKAWTTSDTPLITSPEYTQGDAVVPETVIESGAVDGNAAQFTFSSGEPGVSFECRIDDAPFAPCASPYTTPALSPGPHTFQVRAVNAAGPDPVPATRTFSVAGGQPPDQTATPVATVAATATPAPTATATPTPAPTPEFKQDVVAAPVSGTIEVCDKPGVNCTKLAAGAQVPLNKTIDARKGVVVLSSVGADGKVETAKFSDGMFKVSQTATTTDLTLNEPLAPCSSKKAGKARVSAAEKKPKSRKLWGDGKGRFRTKGRYSAATVRGTKWLTQDTCAGTLTRVTQGVVAVRDNVRGKTITLRAGKRYTAQPR